MNVSLSQTASPSKYCHLVHVEPAAGVRRAGVVPCTLCSSCGWCAERRAVGSLRLCASCLSGRWEGVGRGESRDLPQPVSWTVIL